MKSRVLPLALLLALGVSVFCAFLVKAPKAPDHYFFLNDECDKFDYPQISTAFGPQSGKKVAVGNAILIYMFSRPMEQFKELLVRHFSMAEEYDIPILVELDPITFWQDVPELWNWWDPTKPGYDPKNKENVEWTSWSSEDAVKVGWLNWGRQIRLLPMPNLFSPAYQAAVKDRMDQFMTWTADWYKSLPKSKKYLLGGVKITGELGFGVNNWYYPGGNSYYDKPEEEDPKGGIRVDEMPSRGVGQIGYAALKYSGIRSEGEITPADIYSLEKEYAGFVADIAQGYGFPRGMLFSHSGGAGDDLAAAVQPNSCPTWSFYWAEAADPSLTPQVSKYLKMSDAPYWGCSEWNIGDKPKEDWTEALRNCYSIPGCRFISLFNYGTIFSKDQDGNLVVNDAAVEALKEIQ